MSKAPTLQPVRDSHGNRVKGLYRRGSAWVAGANLDGKWTLRTLAATNLSAARAERAAWTTNTAEGRIAAPTAARFEDVFRERLARPKLSERTRAHEAHLYARHVGPVLGHKRIQTISASEIAALLRGMHDRPYSEWTCTAVFRILAGTFRLASKRKLISANPIDGLEDYERPGQANARRVHVLDRQAIERLIAAGGSERWRAALALASYAGLRIGELRALTWADVDRDAGMIHVRRSMLPDGTPKPPKTGAGLRSVPILPALRRVLNVWQARSPHTLPGDLVLATAEGKPLAERNLRRSLDQAKTAAGLDATEDRLSWHSLRHSFASLLVTELAVPPTTVASYIGHSDAGFTLKVYAKDGRSQEAARDDLLARAEAAGIGR